MPQAQGGSSIPDLERLPAEKIRALMREGHPAECPRSDVIDEITRRGPELLEDLGWPAEMDAVYRNVHTGRVRTLEEILTRHYRKERNGTKWKHLFGVVEHWKPAEGKNVEKARFRAGKKGCRSLEDFSELPKES